ncbi:transcriptional regulator FtsR [Nocardia seriolae]|nr:MerR family transcriptional regulator [Nocardia seriolae]MTJ63214.1 MerR family DNA-binding transcriptional regulator [Nocardia seriolae]MTJ74860.1 MerR family DNA-binding transcriptional regulator [Nocardia seriolae]MTJ88982.1 MerR family DNA-binding transcriptional regulator [Nocardia seriolae]MTK32962.1 MerR family DNA-binding transcriptional regulator [Nocardia seriolae]MTK41108.1 MerR family DNA-binding transcriptional regulator [Nocardia seriolae]
MSIGSVLDLLRPDFPDITISKIRFLESEGLISPERTPSGYRRFHVADVERLRFVLTAQRDQYLPLKVIKEQLEAIDSGAATLGVREARARANAVGGVMPDARNGSVVPDPAANGGRLRRLNAVPGEVSPEELRFDHEIRITRADLLEQAGIDEKFLTELIRANLITPGAAGYFDGDAVTLARTAKALSEFGLEARHLRAFKLAADREAAMVAQIAAPIAKSRDADARARAEETVRELAALSLTLHTCLVKTSVRASLGG